MCTVQTKNGAVSGVREGDCHIWRGIPYAMPPVGDRRFMPAQPVEPWEGVRDASEYGGCCAQPGRNDAKDCLTLNIWAPRAPAKKRAVMLFIHGGSFVKGAGSDPEFDGSILAHDGDVIVVTFNYRLGVLGFMDFSHKDESFSPNCGLTDAIAALRWVYENIEAFGGDSQNITLFGQSAGGYFVSVLTTMPEVKQYIAKAIMMSGAPTLLHPKQVAREIADRYLEFMGITDVTELRNIPAKKLMDRQDAFARQIGMGAAAFTIEVDGELVRDYPIPLAMQGAGADIPILIGTTREEMSFLFVKPFQDAIDIGRVFESGVQGEDKQVADRIAQAYERYGRRKHKRLMSDLVFRMASTWFAEAYSKHAPTWMYRFDYETVATRLVGLHAFHSTDIPFLFGTYDAGITRAMFWLSPIKRGIYRVSREIRNDFTTFAKTGELPWERCDGQHTPGKCYGRKCGVEQVIEQEVKAVYEESGFKKRSFAGKSNYIKG